MKIPRTLSLILFILFPFMGQAQSLVKGEVYNTNNGEMVSDVKISITPVQKKLITDDLGRFQTKLETGNYQFIFTKPQFQSKILSVIVKHNDTLVDLGHIYLQPQPENLSTVVISNITDFVSDNKKPIAVANISKMSIHNAAIGKDLPEIFNELPSVYATKKGGGIGDSRISIRGFNQRNIAVLINGVPVNDMQTGWVYWSNWLNLPDITNAAQLQSGMGASKLAIPSVGGTINILTASAQKQKGGSLNYAYSNYGLHKIVASYNTGLLKTGLSASMQLGHTNGEGYVNMTGVDAYTYYFNMGYLIPNQKHQFMFNVMGAPQWHYQRNLAPTLSDFLRYSNTSEPNIKYNSEWGYLKGQAYSWSKNYFHKPIISLNWDWFINDHWQLNNVIYGMFGRGGGTGAIGAINYHYPNDPLYRGQDGQIRFDDINTWNSGGHVPDFGADRIINAEGLYINKIDEGLTRYAFMNHHAWYGGVFNLQYNPDEQLSASLGIDLRTTYGKNALTVNDVLGGDAYFDNSDVNHSGNLITSNDFQPATYDWNPFISIDDLQKIVFFNQANINWLGGFGQINYKTGKWTGFLQAGFSNQSFQRIDFFNLPKGEQKSKWKRIGGGNIKAGLGYDVNNHHEFFINSGFFSKQPLYNAVFPNWSNNEIAAGLKNEKIYSTEIGYRQSNEHWHTFVNLYYTVWKDRYETVSDFINNQQVSGILKNIQEVHSGIEAISKAHFNKWYFYGMLSVGNWYYKSNLYDVPLYNFHQQLVAVKDYFLDGVKVGKAAQFTAMLKSQYRFNRHFKFYISQQYVDNLYAKIDAASFSNPNHQGSLKLPAYSLMNAGLNYRFKYKELPQVILRINVQNLMDKKYISESETNLFPQHYIDLWHGVNTQNRVFFGWGRTWNFSVKLKF